MAALVRHPLIDEILDARRQYARGDTAAFEGYRNHAHRLYNFARSISSPSSQDEDETAIAAAFHDLCAFDGLDYLEPSIKEAARYVRETERQEWDREVALMIAFHHRVRRPRGEHAKRVEPFRRADWNDFTMGLVRGGIPREMRKAADAELPVTDFVPKAVARLALGWLVRHPPPPRAGLQGRCSPAAHRSRLTRSSPRRGRIMGGHAPARARTYGSADAGRGFAASRSGQASRMRAVTSSGRAATSSSDSASARAVSTEVLPAPGGPVSTTADIPAVWPLAQPGA